jgi:hypothetical protein
MPSCWQEAMSTVFLMFSGRYRLTYEDKAMEAEDQLSRLLVQLDKREDTLRSSMMSLSQEAIRLKDKDRARCKHKVQEYKRAQVQLARLVQYKDMVSVHMDALRNTELNKTLITALQESSNTLKSMGIVEGVRQAELVVSDVEASMAQAQELTAILNAPMTTNITVTDEDLDAELGLLLEEDENEDPILAQASSSTKHQVSDPVTPRITSSKSNLLPLHQQAMNKIEEEEAMV